MQLAYSTGYKYQAREDFKIQLSFAPPFDVEMDFLRFDVSGLFLIKNGYACDGPSGRAFDTPTFMRAAFMHDGGYQLIKNGLLGIIPYREKFDDEMKMICLHDKMWKARAWWCHRAVRRFGMSSALARSIKKVYYVGELGPHFT